MTSYNIIRFGSTVTGSLMFVLAVSFLAQAIYTPSHPEKPGYVIKLPEPAPAAEAAAAAPAPAAADPIAVRLAKADADAGAKTVVGQCVGCHTLKSGEGKKIGPNLYGVVGSAIASKDGFEYSAALGARKAAGERWTFEALDQFLTAPQKAVPNTKMTYNGFAEPLGRANIVAYLRGLSDNPIPLPAP
ncbi:MAG: c-type cytochrome [Bauldia sp.]